jgi:tRNA-binding protein
MTFELQFTLAKVIKVKRNKSARIPSFLLELDVGKELLKDHPKPFYCSSAQITENYEEQDLPGLSLLTLLNFPRKQIGSHMSDCLVTAVQSSSCSDPEAKQKSNILVTAKSFVNDESLPLSPGCIVSFEDYSEECRMKDSHWVTNQRDLTWD